MGILTETTYTCDGCGKTETGNSAKLSVSSDWNKRSLASFDRFDTDFKYRMNVRMPILCRECCISFDSAMTDDAVIKVVVTYGKQHKESTGPV